MQQKTKHQIPIYFLHTTYRILLFWEVSFGYPAVPMRDLQKCSAIFILQLNFIDDYKKKYIIFLYNHAAFQHIFASVLPTT
jgi:hypothetical protein